MPDTTTSPAVRFQMPDVTAQSQPLDTGRLALRALLRAQVEFDETVRAKLLDEAGAPEVTFALHEGEERRIRHGSLRTLAVGTPIARNSTDRTHLLGLWSPRRAIEPSRSACDGLGGSSGSSLASVSWRMRCPSFPRSA